MKNSRQNNCDEVVGLLAEDYLSKSKAQLSHKIGEIAQDFINRGLFNGTARIGKQMHAEFEYLDGLVNHVIQSVKKDFSHIPLDKCKSELITLMEREYKKLIPKINSRLSTSGMVTEGNLKNFENAVLKEIEKAKEKIEIQCAISGKEKEGNKHKAEKWYQNRTIQAALITGGFMLVAALLTTPLWVPFINKMFSDLGESTRVSTTHEAIGDSSDAIVTSGPNSLLKKDEKTIEPEGKNGDVDRTQSSPIIKIPEEIIQPEETTAEVNEPKKPDIIKRKEKPIEPEDQ